MGRDRQRELKIKINKKVWRQEEGMQKKVG
jgi:hypothetical protein